jgi:hypothetical protein
MASKCIALEDLRSHLDHAKDRISREKQSILKMNPLPEDFNREEYAFTYKRAERLGLRAINRKLSEIAWLPMQLDAKTEILSDSEKSLKRWLTSSLVSRPDAEEFGNDFIHALTRCGLKSGWDDGEVTRLAARVATLFRDLSCLIGLIYYCTWLNDNAITGIEVTDPSNLCSTVEEIAALIESPELMKNIRAREQDDNKAGAIAAPKKMVEAKVTHRQTKPKFHVITNDAYIDPMMPDPVGA